MFASFNKSSKDQKHFQVIKSDTDDHETQFSSKLQGNMDFDLVRPVRLTITILTCLGSWRVTNGWKSFYQLYCCVLHLIFSGLTIASIWANVFVASDIDELSKTLFLSLVELAYLGKFFNLFVFKGRVVEIFENFQGVRFDLRSTDEVNIFQDSHRRFNKLQVFYIGACTANVIFGFPVTALLSKSRLLYPALIPFNLAERVHWLSYLFQLTGMFVTCVTNVAIDMLQCYVLLHISLGYRLIAQRLINLECGDLNTQDMDKAFMKNLSEVVQLQQLLARMTKKCEEFISCPVLVEVLLSSFILCFTAYELANNPLLENPGVFFGSMHLLFSVGMQVYFPCHYSHEVTVQSEKLSYALYSSNWVNLPLRSRKIIFAYMEFLKHPVYLTAGNLFTFGLPIFAKTVNNAYNCFAILINMSNE